MNPREQGFLLLTSLLGDPARRPLTMAQLRTLAQRVRGMEPPAEDRELTAADLMALGYGPEAAGQILGLLDQGALLASYTDRGRRWDCYPITRVTPDYPRRLRTRLGLDSPGCLWAKGDRALLATPCVALVGSRDMLPENADFAAEVGRQAALQGFTLVSGNARGADRIAQNSCLRAGGRVISVVADALEAQPLRRNTLYLSEDGFDLAFTSQRALSRNRVIHCLAQKALVAQCRLRAGGTWNGTQKNLLRLWSPVFCFNDGSPASRALMQLGATLIGVDELRDISALAPQIDYFDQ